MPEGYLEFWAFICPHLPVIPVVRPNALDLSGDPPAAKLETQDIGLFDRVAESVLVF
jgi:hypothetical protein